MRSIGYPGKYTGLYGPILTNTIMSDLTRP